MRTDAYFNKLASQKGKGNKIPLLSDSTKANSQFSRHIKRITDKSRMVTRHWAGDNKQSASSETSPAPTRRIHTIIDEYFDEIMEKRADMGVKGALFFVKRTA